MLDSGNSHCLVTFCTQNFLSMVFAQNVMSFGFVLNIKHKYLSFNKMTLQTLKVGGLRGGT